MVQPTDDSSAPIIQFPAKGQPRERVLDTMRAARQQDVHWREGKAWSLVFYPGEEILDLLKEAYTLFFSENGLNPTAFPSLRKFETEVVGMTASLLGGDGQTVGNMTAGGTESILVAVYTAREWARAQRPNVRVPEMVVPVTAHPAFDKAAHYFGLKLVHIPVRPHFADVAAARAVLTPNTILMVGSAPSYPHGVVDPIAELAQIAQAAGILFHVDACVGGFMLPFARRLGYPVPDFDLRVPGVTSISADLHKYGYAAKGASVVLYRNGELRRHQFFVSTAWPGGIYALPGVAGTRPGGAIAAAWAVMNYLGEEGYLAIAQSVLHTAARLRAGIDALAGIHVLSNPDMSVMAIGSEALDVFEIADEMTLRGWHLDRQQNPPSLHLTVNYAHVASVDAFLADLAAAVARVSRPSLRRSASKLALGLAHIAARLLPPAWVSRLAARAGAVVSGPAGRLPQRSAPMYGMLGALPNRGDVDRIVLDLLDGLTRPNVQ